MRRKITEAEEQYVQNCANSFAEEAKDRVSWVLRGWKLQYEDTSKIDGCTKEMIVFEVIRSVLWSAFEVVDAFIEGVDEDIEEE